jgi:hypothetical protein
MKLSIKFVLKVRKRTSGEIFLFAKMIVVVVDDECAQKTCYGMKNKMR